MQIYGDENISLTSFYCLSIVFPMFRQKVFQGFKSDHQKLSEKLKYEMHGVTKGLAQELVRYK